MLATGSINTALAGDREIDRSNRSRAEKCSLGIFEYPQCSARVVHISTRRHATMGEKLLGSRQVLHQTLISLHTATVWLFANSIGKIYLQILQ